MKEKLLDEVKQLIEKRMATSWEAMQNAQAAANEESKSSVGDKYETGRAMAQIDRDMNARQYEQARQEREILEKIKLDAVPNHIKLGSLVETSMGYFFLAVSIGAIKFEGKNIMVISTQSPIGQLLLGKKPQETFVLRAKTEKVLRIE